jgi:hypothetical protein
MMANSERGGEKKEEKTSRGEGKLYEEQRITTHNLTNPKQSLLVIN